jgi:gluconokinase
MAEPDCIVVMGVSGSGKTTLARGIADRMHWRFQEGDDLHPPANVAKMAHGEPLTDDDRWPWLDAVGRWIDAQEADAASCVVTCSALRRAYRDVLTAGRPQVRFCHVTADSDLVRHRVELRRGHYMPPSLLPSQLATLKPLGDDEPGVTVSAVGDPADVLDRALRALGLDEGDRT